MRHSRCSLEKKVLLLLNNHAAHVFLTAVEFCHDHGIVLRTIPSKTTHKLQTLDVAVYNPFKRYYANGIDAWHRNYRGQTMNIYDIPAVVNSAYIKAFTPSNITNGFRACGVVPYDKDIFPDSDYSSSYVSDRLEPASSFINQFELNVESNCPVSTIPDLFPPPPTDSLVSSNADSSTANLQATVSSSNPYISPVALLSFPKAAPRKTSRPSRSEKTRILTKTTEKNRVGRKRKTAWKAITFCQ